MIPLVQKRTGDGRVLVCILSAGAEESPDLSVFCHSCEQRKVKSVSSVQLFATPGTVTYQALAMGFSRQEYWSGLPFPSLGELPDLVEPWSPAMQADAYRLSHLKHKHVQLSLGKTQRQNRLPM